VFWPLLAVAVAAAVPLQVSQAEPLPPLTESHVMPLKGVELSAEKTSVSGAQPVRSLVLCMLLCCLWQSVLVLAGTAYKND
jgi:hypothetical protein